MVLSVWGEAFSGYKDRADAGRFPLDKINDAFDVLRKGEGLRSIIAF